MTNGMVNGAVWSLAPIYAKGLGLSLTGIAVFVSVAIVGGALVQYPLGRLSDRLPDRRWLIAGLCGIAACAGFVLMFGTALPLPALYTAYLLFGAAAFSIYGFSVAHANDHAGPGDFVEISAGLLVIFGVGAVAGPLLASWLMEALGFRYLFLFTCAVHAGVALWAVWRTGQRGRRRSRGPRGLRADGPDVAERIRPGSPRRRRGARAKVPMMVSLTDEGGRR